MEEIRQVALAYYHNFSEDEKYEAYQAFREIDSNGDGTITIDEYEENFGTDHRSRFREVDTNGDGKLDFEEFITLYYLVNSGMVLCDGHGCKVNFLKGLYFTCVDCFSYSKTNTFDLCTSCYRYRNFLHNHTNFLDNHVLMRCKAAYLQDQLSLITSEAICWSDDQAGESESEASLEDFDLLDEQ
ncbi:hypothetical protein CerSpe_005090 [Prunus speciosa]